MSRRDTINISEIINQCKEYKDGINSLKKLSEPLEKQIKEYAITNNLEIIKSDKWQANIKIIPKQDFNADKAIELLKENLPQEIYSSCVKTREYIDEDALEKLIYNGNIEPELLASCTIDNEPTIRLTIGKIK